MTLSFCSVCGCHIEEGAGRYVTPDKVLCSECGPPFPQGPGVKVQITIIDAEGKLSIQIHKQKQEVTQHGKR